MNPLQIFYPVKPLHINQGFGESPSVYARFNLKGHNGNDLYALHGQPVYAAHSGFAYYEIDDSQGEGVVVISDTQYLYKDKPTYIKTVYWHLCNAEKEPHYKSPIINFNLNSKGQPVAKGDLLGFADNTGFSTGDHLHFGLKPITGGITENTAANLEQNNGYLGAIDPRPFYNGFYANDKYDFLRDLYVGSFNVDVLELQKRLKVEPAAGFFGMGIFGPKTREAVIAYQKKYAIPQTGTAGPITRAALNRMWPA